MDCAKEDVLKTIAVALRILRRCLSRAKPKSKEWCFCLNARLAICSMKQATKAERWGDYSLFWQRVNFILANAVLTDMAKHNAKEYTRLSRLVDSVKHTP